MVVGDNDVHYLCRADGVPDGNHHILVQGRRWRKKDTEKSGDKSDSGYGRWYGSDGFYIKTRAEMAATGGFVQRDLENSLVIAERCTFQIGDLPNPAAPQAIVPGPGEDPAFEAFLNMGD